MTLTYSKKNSPKNLAKYNVEGQRLCQLRIKITAFGEVRILATVSHRCGRGEFYFEGFLQVLWYSSLRKNEPTKFQLNL